jgi:preprotein translocase subunit SecF
MHMNFVENRKKWFIISGILVAGSIIVVTLLGLRLGIDFTGGSLLEVEFETTPVVSEVRTTLSAAGFTDVAVQSTGEHGVIIRTDDLTEGEHQNILTSLEENHGSVDEMRFDSIGPVIGDELRRTALMGVALTLLLIGLYVAWAFRKVSEPVTSWKYGALTIVAAFHDVIITLGAFSLLGHFFGWEIGTAFVAATLTILGYSINDTVVVFDRTRENLLRRAADTFEETVEMSIQETLHRSINTSVTTLLALTAIFIFGGDSTQPFALALIIGIAIGTYSSLFLASPALVEWELTKKR